MTAFAAELTPPVFGQQLDALAASLAEILGSRPLEPEDFLAKPNDPAFDNGPAFALMAAALNLAGRGKVQLKQGAVYWVGAQLPNAAGPSDVGSAVMRYAPVTPHIMEITGCSGTVIVDLNGATIKCRAGLFFGSFNANETPFVGQATLNANAATPYFSMINIHDNTGDVFVLPGELDGNIANQTIGGGFGDTGIQFPMYGVHVGTGNSGRVAVLVNSHSQGVDGGIIDADGLLNGHDNIDLSGNYHGARQGVSVVGGVGVTLGANGGIRCHRVGKDIGSMTYSLPGAGIDCEASGGKWVVCDIYNPDIADNSGAGLNVPASVTIGKVKTHGGKLVGTTSFAYWAEAAAFEMEGTTVVGSALTPYVATNQPDRSYFKRVRFSNDPALSPSGVVYLFGSDPLAARNGSTENPIFDTCSFEYVHNAGAGMNLFFPDCDYIDCSFQGPAGTTNIFEAFGTFSGRQTDFVGTAIYGVPRADVAATLGKVYPGPSFDSFTYNGTRYEADSDRTTGKRVFYGSATFDPASLAAGAKTTIQTLTVTGVALGDKVEDVSFSLNLAGARIAAWVSATDTVSFYFVNENGTDPLDLGSGTVRVKVRQA